jgi:hypothetical protein
MLHSSHTQHLVGQMFQVSAAAFHDHNFKAIVFVQVHVCRRKHLPMRVVLDACQFVGQVWTMVVIDH